MTRKTEREKTFKDWCEENGGEFELIANESRCKHPNGGSLKYEDPAFKRQNGSLVVPFSDGEDSNHDFIMYKSGYTGPSGFGDVTEPQMEDEPETALSFLDRQEFEFTTIDFGEEGFRVFDEGKY